MCAWCPSKNSFRRELMLEMLRLLKKIFFLERLLKIQEISKFSLKGSSNYQIKETNKGIDFLPQTQIF